MQEVFDFEGKTPNNIEERWLDGNKYNTMGVYGRDKNKPGQNYLLFKTAKGQFECDSRDDRFKTDQSSFKYLSKLEMDFKVWNSIPINKVVRKQ